MTRLVAVVVKKNRLNTTSRVHGHTYKALGGVLNPDAVHGQGYYVRRMVGQAVPKLMTSLSNSIEQQG